MLKFFRDRKINKLAQSAKLYVLAFYKYPSVVSSVPNDSDACESEACDSAAKYSDRDSYNSNSIDVAFRDFYKTDSLQTISKLIEKNTNLSFSDKMVSYIREKKLQNSDVYKAAWIDRRLFSKILSDRFYKPSKDTCVAIALALKLTVEETNDLLLRAGYALSHSSKRDVVIEYFFREKIYDMYDVNEILERLGEQSIGR